MERLKHVALLYTYNRPELLGRSIRCWLEQEYTNKQLLIFNNSSCNITLHEFDNSQNIKIWNNHISTETNQEYNNLGQIIYDSFEYFKSILFQEDNIITFWQDDDIYFSNFLNAITTFKGDIYKAKQFIFYNKQNKEISITENNAEGTWFLKPDFIKNYHNNRVYQDSQKGLYDYITIIPTNYIIDSSLPISYVYEWGNNIFHLSGNMDNKDNFKNYREHNNKHESNIIVWSKEKLMNYYKDNNLLQWMQ